MYILMLKNVISPTYPRSSCTISTKLKNAELYKINFARKSREIPFLNRHKTFEERNGTFIDSRIKRYRSIASATFLFTLSSPAQTSSVDHPAFLVTLNHTVQLSATREIGLLRKCDYQSGWSYFIVPATTETRKFNRLDRPRFDNTSIRRRRLRRFKTERKLRSARPRARETCKKRSPPSRTGRGRLSYLTPLPLIDTVSPCTSFNRIPLSEPTCNSTAFPGALLCSHGAHSLFIRRWNSTCNMSARASAWRKFEGFGISPPSAPCPLQRLSLFH